MDKKINFKIVGLSVAISLMIAVSIMLGVKIQEDRKPTTFMPKAAEKTYETSLALNPDTPTAIPSPTSKPTTLPTTAPSQSPTPTVSEANPTITSTPVPSITTAPTEAAVSSTKAAELPASGMSHYSIIAIGVAMLIIVVSFVF